MTKKNLGKMHVCRQCGGKFFDLNKKEPACPSCGFLVSDAPPPKIEPKKKKVVRKKKPVVIENLDELDEIDELDGNFTGEFDEELDGDFAVADTDESKPDDDADPDPDPNPDTNTEPEAGN